MSDHWFITVSHDWGWLRRTWFVLTWPLWLAWARLRMWWHNGGDLASTPGIAEERPEDSSSNLLTSTEDAD